MRQTGSSHSRDLENRQTAAPAGFLRWSEHVTFGSTGSLDRAVGLRKDETRITMLWSGGQARVLPMWRGKPLLAQRAPSRLGWVGTDHPVVSETAIQQVFLGLVGGIAHFAADISQWSPPPRPGPQPTRFYDPSDQSHPALPADTSFQDLRGVMAGLSATEAELAASARAVLNWHRESRFCGRCGTPMQTKDSGWLRRCPSCHAQIFPRTEPAVMMPVIYGNQLLLGRAPRWPDGLYSILAGFVEPGETIEAAVRREVAEETGVAIGAVRYLASQAWPYPGNVLVGCHAEALESRLTLDTEELADAVWVSREDMVKVLNGRDSEIRIPWKGTMAHFLIRNWLADRLE